MTAAKCLFNKHLNGLGEKNFPKWTHLIEYEVYLARRLSNIERYAFTRLCGIWLRSNMTSCCAIADISLARVAPSL